MYVHAEGHLVVYDLIYMYMDIMYKQCIILIEFTRHALDKIIAYPPVRYMLMKMRILDWSVTLSHKITYSLTFLKVPYGIDWLMEFVMKLDYQIECMLTVTFYF